MKQEKLKTVADLLYWAQRQLGVYAITNQDGDCRCNYAAECTEDICPVDCLLAKENRKIRSPKLCEECGADPCERACIETDCKDCDRTKQCEANPEICIFHDPIQIQVPVNNDWSSDPPTEVGAYWVAIDYGNGCWDSDLCRIVGLEEKYVEGSFLAPEDFFPDYCDDCEAPLKEFVSKYKCQWLKIDKPQPPKSNG